MNAAIERAPREQIEALQRERLAATVERVRRTPLGEALALERFDLVARCALNRGVHGRASSARGSGSGPG